MTVNPCQAFHASHEAEVVFDNSTGNTDCIFDAIKGQCWPFKEGFPFTVSAHKTIMVHIKRQIELAIGKHSYNVSCCMGRSEKSVTVP
jgi:hypothetical protein